MQPSDQKDRSLTETSISDPSTLHPEQTGGSRELDLDFLISKNLRNEFLFFLNCPAPRSLLPQKDQDKGKLSKKSNLSTKNERGGQIE